jgi:3-methyl-2-oxobutanoate hydroxymethyltransferase
MSSHSSDDSIKKNISIPDLIKKKEQSKKITMLTAYDYQMAGLIDACSIDIILVGDSLGQVTLGYDSTIPVSLESMIHHAKAVKRAVKHALVIVDMPFLSFQISNEDAIRNAGQVLKETACDGVKIEGGWERMETVSTLVQAGIPVMGHIGLQPQMILKMGGYRVQGRNLQSQSYLKQSATSIQEAGAFSIVLELVIKSVAEEISKTTSIPTIGIGSGNGCDGQVLVINDLLGMVPNQGFKHCRIYDTIGTRIQKAVTQYKTDVESGSFPSDDESFLS